MFLNGAGGRSSSMDIRTRIRVFFVVYDAPDPTFGASKRTQTSDLIDVNDAL